MSEDIGSTLEMSGDIAELAAALSKAQGAIEPAEKDGVNPHFRSHYATLASVWGACRTSLAANGLSVVQLPEPHDGGIVLRTVLLHSSGQWLASRLPLSCDPGNAQAVGSALTYARRYALAAIVGVVADDDDDGNAAAAHPATQRPQQQQPARQQQHQPAGGGGERRQHDGPPRTGKALFAWARSEEDKGAEGVVKYLNDYGKQRGFGGRMVEWSGQQVAEAHAALQQAMQPAPDDTPPREPGADDDSRY